MNLYQKVGIEVEIENKCSVLAQLVEQVTVDAKGYKVSSILTASKVITGSQVRALQTEPNIKRKMKLNLSPLQDYLVVQIEAKTEKSAGGLYMPDSAEKPRMTGTVLAIGPDVENVKDGDTVYVTYKDAFATTVSDTWIFPEKNILAIVS